VLFFALQGKLETANKFMLKVETYFECQSVVDFDRDDVHAYIAMLKEAVVANKKEVICPTTVRHHRPHNHTIVRVWINRGCTHHRKI
jgi:hypothetical protein